MCVSVSVCVHLSVYVCLYVCVGSRVLSLLEGDKFRRRGWQHHWEAGSGEGGNLRLCRKSPRIGARRAGPLSCVRGPCHPTSVSPGKWDDNPHGRAAAGLHSVPTDSEPEAGRADASWISTKGSWLPQEWGWAEAGTSRLSPGPGASGL